MDNSYHLGPKIEGHKTGIRVGENHCIVDVVADVYKLEDAEYILAAVNAYDKLQRDNKALLDALRIAYVGLTEYQSGDEFDEKVQVVFAAIQQAEEAKG